MTDRLVRQIYPTDRSEQTLRPFSTYLAHRNLVLLGDPGAGKTHLFRHFSAPDVPYRARDFLNTSIEALRAKMTLFIDGLDEKRSARGEQSTVDAIITKLWEIAPSEVRISCRAQDWLGDSDLVTFRSYFDQAGGVVVLSLEALTHDEQVAVLTQRGISDAEAFLAEAKKRGLDELLTNPQNLIMLADVVRKQNWPSSRGELFNNAVDLLLAEHNPDHSRRETGRYLPRELRDVAGLACAARLIGDAAGISLANSPGSESLPSYRTVRQFESDKVLAALCRRAFIAGAVPETVDYLHRTIAEYLAAQYLAKRVRDGLPLGRVRALIGLDGEPASELRGLHGWLAVLLTEGSRILIEADPFGVLTYGDAASLSRSDREHLIRALGQLSKSDPWFRRGDWSASSAIGALSGPDMTESFRAILRDDAAGFAIRSIVLDALSVGTPILELTEDLVAILLSSKLEYAERDGALGALLNAGPDGRDAVARVYPTLSPSVDDLRLRTRALPTLTGAAVPTEIARLLNDALSIDKELGGVFWTLTRAVGAEDLPDVLGQWISSRSSAPSPKNRRNVSEVLIAIDDLLIRYLSSEMPIEQEMLFMCLKERRALSDHYDYGRAEKLKAALSSNARVLSTLIEKGVHELIAGGRSWALQVDLAKLLVGANHDSLVLQCLMKVLNEITDEEKRQIAYEAAMACCFRLGESAVSQYETLLSYADDIPSLHAVRQSCRVWEIPDWRLEQNEHRAKERAKRDARIAKTREDFEPHRLEIQNGTHLGWLSWIADIYFARYADFDAQATPRDRLITELGEENAEAAIEGLRALVLGGHISSLAEIVDLHSRDKYYRWWLAVVAGLDECADAGLDVCALPTNYLQSALAIDLLHPTYRKEGNVSHRYEHSWKKAVIEKHPQLVVDAYSAIVRSDLQRNSLAVYGLSEIMHTKEFAPFRAEVASRLIEDFPSASPVKLGELLCVVLQECEKARVLKLVRAGLDACRASGNQDSYRRWLAAGLVIDIQEFRAIADQLDQDGARSLVWALRDNTGPRSVDQAQTTSFSPEVLEYVISLAARTFDRSEPPESGWQGDTNAWDATRYVHNLIARLSRDISDGAKKALVRLLSASATTKFHDDIRHALANQRTLLIDATFSQPTWTAVLDALRGGPPANVADLHALVLAHLDDLGPIIAASNTDIFKRFWNEDSYGRTEKPKAEESCRDVLVDLLRPRLAPFGVSVEPEGHMALDGRTDIAIYRPGMKVVIELKRHYHAELWTAIREQLERFYTRDPDAQGYGIYGVLWFGDGRPKPTPMPPDPRPRPRRPEELLSLLRELLPPEKRDKLTAVVIDVSGDVESEA